MILWIASGEQRTEVAWSLVANGYVVVQVTRPNKEYPYTRVDYGIQIICEPDQEF